jgi:hypothetical protein
LSRINSPSCYCLKIYFIAPTTPVISVISETVFLNFKELRNQLQGSDSASLCIVFVNLLRSPGIDSQPGGIDSSAL